MIMIMFVEGIDARGTEGRSFAARLKRELSPLLDFWHCGEHKYNLGLNDTVEAVPAMKNYYLPHLRMAYSEFKRSSKNRSTFKDLLDWLKERYPNINWKLFLPVLFNLTRWLGLYYCAEMMSKPSVRALLVGYRQKLRDRGMGPRPFDPHRYRRRREVRDAHLGGADDRDGDDSSEEEEVQQAQQALDEDRNHGDGYQPGPELFPSVADAAASAPTQRSLSAAENFDVGNVAAPKLKRKNLLNPHVGLTEVNAGRSAWLCGVLKPYKIVVEHLQKFDQPRQHLIARQMRRFYMVMKTAWIGTETAEPMYNRTFQKWIDDTAGNEDLVKLVKKECRAFASVFVSSIKERFKGIWNYYQAFELIDPKGPDLAEFGTPEVWAAMSDLCRRRGVDFDLFREQVNEIRAEAPSLDVEDKALIKTNLCAYLRQRHKTFILTRTESPTPEHDEVCQFVFSIPITSAFVESLFSKMAYNQGKLRPNLKDTTMTSILHMHDAVLPNPQQPLPRSITLKVHAPKSPTDKLLMDKMIGQRVCEEFEGVRYHGSVTEIRFHDVYAQYMYHVEFEDGDECDYWRHELEMIRCRCDERGYRVASLFDSSDSAEE